jgi:hypothetical protein
MEKVLSSRDLKSSSEKKASQREEDIILDLVKDYVLKSSVVEEKVVWSGFVNVEGKKRQLEGKVFVVSLYRLYLFGYGRKMQAKKLKIVSNDLNFAHNNKKSEFHLYDLQEIQSADNTKASLFI